MASTRKPTPVKDSNLLEEDEDTLILDNYDKIDSPQHVGGKDLSLLSKPGQSGLQQPTPPRTLSPSTSTPHLPQPPPPALKHVTKLDVYIHTSNNKALQKIVAAQFACNRLFYTKPLTINSIIQRAEHLVMRQEPFNTLLSQGLSFTLTQPQISYRVLTLEENQLIDFVVDLADEDLQSMNPTPYYELYNGNEHTHTDVSFFFDIKPIAEPAKKPKTADAQTLTFDAGTLSPFIDQFRTAAANWTLQQKDTRPSKSTPTIPPTLSLSTTAPPKHILHHDKDKQQKHKIQERLHPHARLGPPVQHKFKERSRSRSGDRDRTRRYYRSRSGSEDHHRRSERK